MLGRIVRSADFERVLGIPACARSPHFALHYLAERPSRPACAGAAPTLATQELSTGHEPAFPQLVDDLAATAPSIAWLGTVVPKRHARRAVTRNLLKRQIRGALRESGASGTVPLPPGLWVVRLRAPFDRQAFVSAASSALRRVARAELDDLLVQATRRLQSASRPGTR